MGIARWINQCLRNLKRPSHHAHEQNQNRLIPRHYQPLQSVKETEHAIKNLKDFVELILSRVKAPLFVQGGTGINDDL